MELKGEVMLGSYIKNVELIDAHLYKSLDAYFLYAQYKFEDDKGVHLLTIPSLKLPIFTTILPSVMVSGSESDATVTIDLGFGDLVAEGIYGDAYRIETLEKKGKKMTLAEIEEALGYSIELVEEDTDAKKTSPIMK